METSLFVPTIDVRQRIQPDIIRFLARQIADRFHPRKIILFGSYAYGQSRPESDIDLLIIMKTELREAKQALQIRQFLNPLFGLDIILYTPEKMDLRLAWGIPF